MLVYYNIETIPPIGTAPGPDLVHIPGNVTKEETKEKYRNDPEKQKEGWKKLAVNKSLAQIFITTILIEDDDDPIITQSTDQESLIGGLEDMLRVLYDDKPASEPLIYVTYNGLEFDFPLTWMRALRYRRFDLARWMFPQNKWGDATHWDIFQMFGGKGKLDDWSEGLGFVTDNPIRSSEVCDCFLRNQRDKLIRHTTSRVVDLREITRLLLEAGIVRP